MKVLIENKTQAEILKYFKSNSRVFFEPLDNRVNIDEYARKLAKFSTQFWLYDEGSLVGFMAAYLNDTSSKIAYISTISVIKSYQGKGGGKLLINNLIQLAARKKFYKIRLEVAANNSKAIRFYRKQGFYLFMKKDESYIMEKPLSYEFNDKPLVSICSLSYNHSKYIRKSLDSLLSQKTSFRFEIIVHDDASSDGTSEILREYAEKYPEIIKPIFQKENQYSKGIKPIFEYVFPMANGKYIALCETDDYWIDPYKLQKQVDFMEKNPDVVICGTNWLNNYYGKHQVPALNFDKGNKRVFYFEDLLKENIFKPSTVLFRKIVKLPNYLYNIKFIDRYLWLHILSLNKKNKGVVFVEEITTIYNLHTGGIYTGSKDYIRTYILFRDKFIFSLNTKFINKVSKIYIRDGLYLIKINFKRFFISIINFFIGLIFTFLEIILVIYKTVFGKK